MDGSINITKEIEKLENQIKYVRTYLSKSQYQHIRLSKMRGKYSIYVRSSELTCESNLNKSDIENNSPLKDDATLQVARYSYVSRKSPAVAVLCRTKYYQALLPVLEEELALLKQFEIDYKPDNKYRIIETIPEDLRGSVSGIIIPPADYIRAWHDRPFQTNSYPFSDTQNLITRNNERVRSKAEYIIANLLSDMGLIYRYEAALNLEGRIIYPDFTIIHPVTLEEYYLEYFGMMDDKEYLSNALNRIAMYQRSEFSNRFICIFESQYNPMNIDSIKALLENTFFKCN